MAVCVKHPPLKISGYATVAVWGLLLAYIDIVRWTWIKSTIQLLNQDVQNLINKDGNTVTLEKAQGIPSLWNTARMPLIQGCFYKQLNFAMTDNIFTFLIRPFSSILLFKSWKLQFCSTFPFVLLSLFPFTHTHLCSLQSGLPGSKKEKDHFLQMMKSN